MCRYLNTALLLSLLAGCLLTLVSFSDTNTSSRSDRLKGRVILLDPGHGGTAATDAYRVGPSGEREEWINLRVARLLGEMLEKAGATVILTRMDDSFVALDDRSKLALDNKADLFVSIHHNATADSTVNFPIIYFHGSALENAASVVLGQKVAAQLRKKLFDDQGPFSLVSDYTIFSKSGASVLRGTYGIPGIIAEASFFTHPGEEKRLKSTNYNETEARAYFEGIIDFFSGSVPEIQKKKSPLEISPFEVFQEAERMRPEALQWRANYEAAKGLMESGEKSQLDSAYQLLTLSVRSFPDSYVAKHCHVLRADILARQGKKAEARMERKRIRAFYP